MSEALAYSPDWAPHVVGTFPSREVDPETGRAEPQLIVMRCGRCFAEHRHHCTTGNVRSWINRFAIVHLHQDILDPARVAEMGRKR